MIEGRVVLLVAGTEGRRIYPPPVPDKVPASVKVWWIRNAQELSVLHQSFAFLTLRA